eukprot:758944-Prorocentrum_minimum.AAC.1
MPTPKRDKCFSCLKPHTIKGRAAYFKPVPSETAHSLVHALGLPSTQDFEPWVNPKVNCSYASDTHVLLKAPLEEGHPSESTAYVAMCMAAYQRKGTSTHFLRTNLPGMRKERPRSSGLTAGEVEGSSTSSTTE